MTLLDAAEDPSRDELRATAHQRSWRRFERGLSRCPAVPGAQMGQFVLVPETSSPSGGCWEQGTENPATGAGDAVLGTSHARQPI